MVIQGKRRNFLLHQPEKEEEQQSQNKGQGQRKKKEKSDGSRKKKTISELDDSIHVMKNVDKKKAQKKGEDAPTYRSGAAIPKSKRKEAKLKAKEKGKKNNK
jgi:hypothetical protein